MCGSITVGESVAGWAHSESLSRPNPGSLRCDRGGLEMQGRCGTAKRELLWKLWTTGSKTLRTFSDTSDFFLPLYKSRSRYHREPAPGCLRRPTPGSGPRMLCPNCAREGQKTPEITQLHPRFVFP